MPFTLSHTAVILPFRKHLNKYFSLSGLLMGSMAPDFEYFLRITLYGKYGHTLLGVFLFDLPVSVLLCIVFHQIVKKPLINHLPKILFCKFHKYIDNNWYSYFKKKYLTVIYSIVIGTFTHIIWDYFTHPPEYMTPFYFAILLKKINLINHSVYFYTILQIVFSIIGLMVFVFTVYKVKATELPQNQTTKNTLHYWLNIVLLSLIIFLIRYLVGVPLEKPLGQMVVISISAFLISLTLVSLFYRKEI